jgi:hypothetical protein
MKKKEYIQDKPIEQKQSEFPWMEVAAAVGSGVVSYGSVTLLTWKKFGDELIDKFPEINEKLGLDIKTDIDFEKYLSEAKKWAYNTSVIPSKQMDEALHQTRICKELEKYALDESHAHAAVSAGIVVGMVVAVAVGFGLYGLRHMHDGAPNNQIKDPTIETEQQQQSQYQMTVRR